MKDTTERSKSTVKLKHRFSSLKTWKHLIVSLFIYVMIFCIAFIILYPILVKLVDSLKSNSDLFDKTVIYVPKSLSLDSYKLAMKAMDFWNSLFNSVIVTLITALLQVFVCTSIGYGFARHRFKGRNLLYVLVILTMLVPPQTIMISQYMQFRYFDIFGIFNAILGHPIRLINTYWPFAVLSATGLGLKNGLYIYLMTQFFKGIPKEFEEAGYVDGAGSFTIFFRIMLPNAIPMLVTILIFSVSWQWTDTYYSGLFLTDLWTLPKSVGAISTYQNGSLPSAQISSALGAATVLIILPLAILYIFTQKYFIQGVENSGIVG